MSNSSRALSLPRSHSYSRSLPLPLPLTLSTAPLFTHLQPHPLSFTESGKVYAWGNNFWGKLGIGGTEGENYPSPVLLEHLAATPIVQIAASTRHSMALTGLSRSLSHTTHHNNN